MTQDMLTSFFGWMTAIHFAVFLISVFTIVAFGNWATQFHARLFGIDEVDVRREMYVWLGRYKVGIIVFALVPYIALRLI